MSNQHKPFKISELPKIQNINNDDLLIVSDYDAGKCTSKKMQVQQLASYILQALKPQIQQIASQTAAQKVDDAIDDVVLPEISSQVQEAIGEEIEPIVNEKVSQAMDSYDIEPKVIKTLDKLDGAEDDVINIAG